MASRANDANYSVDMRSRRCLNTWKGYVVGVDTLRSPATPNTMLKEWKNCVLMPEPSDSGLQK